MASITSTLFSRSPRELNLPLWAPLLSAQPRRHAFTQHRGTCTSCSKRSRSLKNCGVGWRNAFQLLYPAPGQSHDGDQRVKRWQQRMRSYRPRRHQRRNVSPSSQRQYDSLLHSHGRTRAHTQHALQQPQQITAVQPLPKPQSATRSIAPRTNTGPTGIVQYDSSYTANANSNSRQPGTFNVPPTQS